MKKSEISFSVALVVLDFLTVIGGGILAYLLRFSSWMKSYKPILFELTFSHYLFLLFFVALFWVLIFALLGLYRLRVTRQIFKELFLVFLGSLAVFSAIAFYSFFSRRFFQSRFIVLSGWSITLFLISFWHILVKKFQQFLAGRRSLGIHRAVVVAPSRKLRETFARELEACPRLGYELVRTFRKLDSGELTRIVRTDRVDEIFLEEGAFDQEDLVDFISLAHRFQKKVFLLPGLVGSFKESIVSLGMFPVVEIQNTPLEGWGRLLKRVVDIAGASAGLLIFALVYVPVAFAIKWESPGPVLVKLKRVKEGEKTFFLYKFRSMVQDAHKMKKQLLKFSERRGPLFKMRNDPRLTKVGRFLRRFRIDEMPQFINVLKGELSLVGPRPHEPEEVARYKKWQRRVLSIKPGLTGLAQVSGSSELDFDEEARLDIYYIEHWSALLDLKIILKTIFKLFYDRTAV